MSYTLRGRLETRLAAAAPARSSSPRCLAPVLHAWWPLELAGLMVGIGLAARRDALPPAAPVPARLGRAAARAARARPGHGAPPAALELERAAPARRSPSSPAPGSSLQVLAPRGPPAPPPHLARGRRRARPRRSRRSPPRRPSRSSPCWASPGRRSRPTVTLAAGVHQGPLVLDHAQTPRRRAGRGRRAAGSSITADDVTIRDVTVRGGEYGIEVDGAESVVLDGVVVEGAELDGINVRRGQVEIRDCTIRSLPERLHAGDRHLVRLRPRAEPRRGLHRHRRAARGSSRTSRASLIRDNRVTGTELRAITMTEMSMGDDRGQRGRGRARRRDLLRRLLRVRDRGQRRLRRRARPRVGRRDARRHRDRRPLRRRGEARGQRDPAQPGAASARSWTRPSSTSDAIDELRRRSVEVIRDGQDASGAYVASPTFPPYGYSWLRDGSFIADAMSRVGERESAEAFFDWVARIVESGDGFDARYTLDGRARRGDVAAPPARRLGALAVGDAGARAAARPAATAGARRPRQTAAHLERDPRRAVRRLVGGARGRARGHARLHRGRARRRARPLACRGPARREPARPPVPRLRRRRRLAARQPRTAASTGISTTSTTAAASGCC